MVVATRAEAADGFVKTISSRRRRGDWFWAAICAATAAAVRQPVAATASFDEKNEDRTSQTHRMLELIDTACVGLEAVVVRASAC
jgi:hypothetical protein